MKKAVKTGLYIAVVLLIFVVYYFSSEYINDRVAERKGNLIIEKIEVFRASHGRLPANLSEIGVSEDGPIYYTKRDEGYYVVWYGKRLGESGYYDSRTKIWDVGG